jgi:DNA-binding IclR family transcriptional regulator
LFFVFFFFFFFFFFVLGAVMNFRFGLSFLLAWEESEKIHRGLTNARFTAAQLSADRRRGWAQSVGEREAGVASVSAPVRAPNGKVIAAVSISGPIERLGRQPGRIHAAAVVATAARLTEHLARE